MDYSKIIAVTGLPGLQELISTKNDGAIVRSLEDNTTKFVSSRVHNFSHLESIEIYTVRDNVNLVDIFHAMENAGQSLPDEKDAKAVKSYFEKVFPDLDFERVYNSDMKKIVKWYSVLKAKNIEIKLTEVPEEAEEEVEIVEEEKPAKASKAKAAKEKEEVAEEKPKKAAKPKKEEKEKPAAKKEKEDAAPKKKAAAKKPAEKKEETPKKKSAPKKK